MMPDRAGFGDCQYDLDFDSRTALCLPAVNCSLCGRRVGASMSVFRLLAEPNEVLVETDPIRELNDVEWLALKAGFVELTGISEDSRSLPGTAIVPEYQGLTSPYELELHPLDMPESAAQLDFLWASEYHCFTTDRVLDILVRHGLKGWRLGATRIAQDCSKCPKLYVFSASSEAKLVGEQSSFCDACQFETRAGSMMGRLDESRHDGSDFFKAHGFLTFTGAARDVLEREEVTGISFVDYMVDPTYAYDVAMGLRQWPVSHEESVFDYHSGAATELKTYELDAYTPVRVEIIDRQCQGYFSDLSMQKHLQLEMAVDRALENQQNDNPKAVVSEAHLQPVISAIAEVLDEDVVVQIGMLVLIWQHNWDKVFITTLTSSQFSFLTRNDGLYRNTGQLLDYLVNSDNGK